MTFGPGPKPILQPIVQCDLKAGNRVMTTWVNKVKGLEVGKYITLADDEKTTWQVMQIYNQIHDTKDFDWHRKWDNNI